MESYGLVYVPVRTTTDPSHANPSSGFQKRSQGHQSRSNANPNAASASGKGQAAATFGWDQAVTLELEPDINLLLAYSCDELKHRHKVVLPELRQTIYVEQRKYSLQLKAGKGDHREAGGAASEKKEPLKSPSAGASSKFDHDPAHDEAADAKPVSAAGKPSYTSKSGLVHYHIYLRL